MVCLRSLGGHLPLPTFQGSPRSVCCVMSRDFNCKREDLGPMRLIYLDRTKSFLSTINFIVECYHISFFVHIWLEKRFLNHDDSLIFFFSFF